jgi:hypothetical protein
MEIPNRDDSGKRGLFLISITLGTVALENIGPLKKHI